MVVVPEGGLRSPLGELSPEYREISVFRERLEILLVNGRTWRGHPIAGRRIPQHGLDQSGSVEGEGKNTASADGRQRGEPLACQRIPKADRVVPVARGDEPAVGAEDNAIDEAPVSLQHEAGVPLPRPHPGTVGVPAHEHLAVPGKGQRRDRPRCRSVGEHAQRRPAREIPDTGRAICRCARQLSPVRRKYDRRNRLGVAVKDIQPLEGRRIVQADHPLVMADGHTLSIGRDGQRPRAVADRFLDQPLTLPRVDVKKEGAPSEQFVAAVSADDGNPRAVEREVDLTSDRRKGIRKE